MRLTPCPRRSIARTFRAVALEQVRQLDDVLRPVGRLREAGDQHDSGPRRRIGVEAQATSDPGQRGAVRWPGSGIGPERRRSRLRPLMSGAEPEGDWQASWGRVLDELHDLRARSGGHRDPVRRDGVGDAAASARRARSRRRGRSVARHSIGRPNDVHGLRSHGAVVGSWASAISSRSDDCRSVGTGK